MKILFVVSLIMNVSAFAAQKAKKDMDCCVTCGYEMGPRGCGPKNDGKIPGFENSSKPASRQQTPAPQGSKANGV